MKTRIAIFSLVLFIALAIGLEVMYRYHFFFVEQQGLFLFAGHYFGEMVARPGGLAGWVAAFLTQFFVLPFGGAIITAALLTCAAVMTGLICRRLAPRVPLYALWALPALGLLCIHFDFNYLYTGTVAFLIAQAGLYLYICMSGGRARLAVGLVTVPLLFWWCGPVAALYAVCVAIVEIVDRRPGPGFWIAIPIEAALIGWGMILLSIQGDAGLAFTPRGYYPIGMNPGTELWFAWTALPIAMIAARLCRNLPGDTPVRRLLTGAPQILLVAAMGWCGVATYIDRVSYPLKTVDYFARCGQWDDIIAASTGTLDNYLALNYLNLALAEKGILADDLFLYDQHGPEGLFVSWNGALASAVVSSDVQFAIGNPAIAQKMAFVGNVLTGNLLAPSYGSPRLLKRLVEVSIVYALWPVAEKYLDLLDKTLFYRDWAGEHRRFIGNDAAVEADPVLGDLRRCLLDADESYLSIFRPQDLEAIALQNPSHRTAMAYYGSWLLLTKNLEAFGAMVDKYLGTPMLPALPRSHREALLLIYHSDPAAWERYDLPRDLIDRFADFEQRVSAGLGSPGLANSLRHSFGNTYWFYYMFKQ